MALFQAASVAPTLQFIFLTFSTFRGSAALEVYPKRFASLAGSFQQLVGHTPEEAKVVDSILSLRKQGKSYVAIADQLNGDGIKPRSSAKWHPTQVQGVVHRAKAKPRVTYP